MKLRFLGQIYSRHNNQIKPIASETTGHFLGQKYAISIPMNTVKPKLGVRKYRGVIYEN